MQRPRLQSTLARAVVPVAAGIAFFGAMALALWGVAALLSGNSDEAAPVLVPATYEMGSATMIAEIIADDGPIVLQDLAGHDKNIVLSWNAETGFAIHLAHPADRDATCAVVVMAQTSSFEDCAGRRLTIDDLELPARGIAPQVSSSGVLTLDLSADS